MLIGPPGSGKTTWIENHVVWTDEYFPYIVSTDNFIEQVALDNDSTYDDVFDANIKAATEAMYKSVDTAIKCRANIYWDQTNLTVKSRKAKLAKIPSDYRKVAVVFTTRNSEMLKTRLANRPGKTIPASVLNRMINSFEMPTRAEGFDEVWSIET